MKLKKKKMVAISKKELAYLTPGTGNRGPEPGPPNAGPLGKKVRENSGLHLGIILTVCNASQL